MRTFRVKNFERFQHYKDRSPPWIKLYNDLLDDYEFACLQDASKLHLILIWLLASRSSNILPYDSEWIQRRISATDRVDLDALQQAGFIIINQPLPNAEQDASTLQAECLSRDRERKKESKKERTIVSNSIELDSMDAQAGVAEDSSDLEREYFDRGKALLGKSAGGVLVKLLRAKGNNLALARAALEQASTKQDPAEFIGAVCRGPPPAKPLTEFQRRQQETNDVRAQLREAAERLEGGGHPAELFSDNPSQRPEILRGGNGPTVLNLSRIPDRRSD